MGENTAGDEERRIAATFNDCFAVFGIGIRPADVADGVHRTLLDKRSAWAITYRVDRAAGGTLTLEFYATNRRTNDRHAVISADGRLGHLDALSEMLILDSDGAAAEFEARNAAIRRQLRERGLYPHG